MFTDIKTFISDVKELYPEFSFEPYDEGASFEEKFAFFKRLNQSLKEKYGIGYFKAKEELEKFWSKYDEELFLPIACEETNIMYALYSASSELDILEYRIAALKMEKIHTLISNAVIDEYCESEILKDPMFLSWLKVAICTGALSYESVIHYNYKAKDVFLPWFESEPMSEFKINNIDQLRAECKELLKRDTMTYEDICFVITDLWEEKDLAEFAKNESDMVRMFVCCQANCTKKIAKQLMKDSYSEVAFAAAAKYEDLGGRL